MKYRITTCAGRHQKLVLILAQLTESLMTPGKGVPNTKFQLATLLALYIQMSWCWRMSMHLYCSQTCAPSEVGSLFPGQATCFQGNVLPARTIHYPVIQIPQARRIAYAQVKPELYGKVLLIGVEVSYLPEKPLAENHRKPFQPYSVRRHTRA